MRGVARARHRRSTISAHREGAQSSGRTSSANPAACSAGVVHQRVPFPAPSRRRVRVEFRRNTGAGYTRPRIVRANISSIQPMPISTSRFASERFPGGSLRRLRARSRCPRTSAVGGGSSARSLHRSTEEDGSTSVRCLVDIDLRLVTELHGLHCPRLLDGDDDRPVVREAVEGAGAPPRIGDEATPDQLLAHENEGDPVEGHEELHGQRHHDEDQHLPEDGRPAPEEAEGNQHDVPVQGNVGAASASVFRRPLPPIRDSPSEELGPPEVVRKSSASRRWPLL